MGWALFVAAAFALVLAVPAPGARAASDPAETYQWALAEINARSAREVGTGEGITIAIVDTGVDLHHEDLTDNLVLGTNLVSPGQPPQDDNGRGTHVAGIAAAVTDNGKGIAGVAPGADIMPIKVYDDDLSSSTSRIVDGMRWAVDHGAQVVDVTLENDFAIAAPALGTGVQYVWDKGAIPVVSAGNRVVLAPSFADKPAVVVAATTRAGGHPTAYNSDVGDAKWAMAAPGGAGGSNEGDDILSTYWPHRDTTGLNTVEYGRYRYQSGTARAAAHVAGAAAVLRGLGLSRDETVRRLLATAKDIGPPGRDQSFGAGLLDLAKAVQGLRPTTTSTTATGAPAGAGSTTTTQAPGSPAPTAGGVVPPPPSTTAAPPPASAPPADRPTEPTVSAAAPEFVGSPRPDWSPALPLAVGALVLLAAAGGGWWLRHSRLSPDD